jgi:hypothetical protein
MAYDDQEARRSRVVVETPTSRREVTRTEAVREDRRGVSGTTVGIIVVVAIALITMLVLFLMSSQTNDNSNNNLTAAQQAAPPPQTTIVQQPAQQQPPVIIQQAPPATAQAPIIVNNPPAGGSTTNGTDDSTIQAAIDKKLLDDPNLSTLGITVTVLDGKATLIGTVKSETLKSQVERAIRSVKGVKAVDNQITITSV